jgi:hypothetical protein
MPVEELASQELTIPEAMRELREMRKQQQILYKEVDRKRSWRSSEKAMAKATYARRESALLVALQALEKQQRPKDV